ncbi:hypothetical protein QU862_24915, partial [Escherichia coli]|nr:hypothetical protein [Escherichia coli]
SWYWQSNMAQLPAEVSTQPEQSGFFMGPPGGVTCHGAGASRKKAGFCIFMAAAACVIIH